MSAKKVFLGGTCNGSVWRDTLIAMLTIDYFNPVVSNWTPECQAEEIRQRELCDFSLYVITPKMKGVYSIAEVVDDSNKRPGKTVFCILEFDGDDRFEEPQLKSLNALANLITKNGGHCFSSLPAAAEHLNNFIPQEDYEVISCPCKSLDIIDVKAAQEKISDVKVYGDGDTFALLCKASSESQGWMKSTKVCNLPDGCIVQVTTQQKNIDGTYSVAEALSYVPGVNLDTQAEPRVLTKIPHKTPAVKAINSK